MVPTKTISCSIGIGSQKEKKNLREVCEYLSKNRLDRTRILRRVGNVSCHRYGGSGVRNIWKSWPAITKGNCDGILQLWSCISTPAINTVGTAKLEARKAKSKPGTLQR